MQQPVEVLDEDLNGLPLYTLYSKNTIIWYAFLFSPFVGGLLMAINLFRVKKQGIALLAILAALVYTLATYFLATIIIYKASGRLLVLLLNLVGGNLITGPLWRLTIGTLPYNKANGWLPLVFVLLVYGGVTALALYFLGITF